MRLSPTNWCKNIVPRSSDGSCVPKECDDFGEARMTCEPYIIVVEEIQIKNGIFCHGVMQRWSTW